MFISHTHAQGSTINLLENDTLIFASVFGRLPQRVLWRHTGENMPQLSENVLVVKWLPQNDLLGKYEYILYLCYLKQFVLRWIRLGSWAWVRCRW